MQSEDFQPDDLFAQIQSLVNGLDAERRAREAAEASDAAKADLLAMIGGELRTPMETVVAMGEHLLASRLDVMQRRYTQTLTQSARSLLSVLGQVLDFSKLESGEAELAAEVFDLHRLVNGAASVLHARASAKGLTTGVDMVANCPRFVAGDEARVRQVLMYLVEKALQSTSEGSVRLYVSVNDATDPLTVRFDITDTGGGLSIAEQAALFQPSGECARASGVLGLPIARRLAAAMGGEVGCDSALGQGALYWFTLQAPRAEAEAEMPAEREDATSNDEVPSDMAPKTPAPKGALSGHVLVVEDNTVNRMLIGAYLDEFGLTCEMVETGAAALMCLAAQPYNLVLMDTVLPDYDGLKIAKRIRSLQAPSSEVPIVWLVAHDARDDGLESVAAGVNARVSKPIEGRALYAALVPFLPARNDSEALARAS